MNPAAKTIDQAKSAPASLAQDADPRVLLAQSAAQVSELFAQLPSRNPAAPPRLMESIQYSLLAGGKRLRPALVLHCAKACGVDGPASPRWRSALAAAAAMELIHTFSLVHDDLPAMDDDDLRRGRPTNHKVFGQAMAILAGDAMTTLAFEILASDAAADVAAALVQELARAAGPTGMIGGQVIDMDEKKPATLAELQHLHRMKTGALLTASCRMGAIAAGAGQDSAKFSALEAFGRHVGLAFQIVDDILDQTATTQQMGKATGKDAAKGKVTYPLLIGLEQSRAEAQQQLAAALKALEPLGNRGNSLAALARFVIQRDN